MLRATYGADGLDGTFIANRRNARRVGLAVGCYHYAYPSGNDALAEAENFARQVGRLRAGDLRSALDLEEVLADFPLREVEGWAREWNRQAWPRVGACPLFYSNPDFIRRMAAKRAIGCGLWLASWGPNDGSRHAARAPGPWNRFVLHQFTSKGDLPGIAGYVDLNHAPRIRPLLAYPEAPL
jgi:GH25 family lysozyme M1 (1,4-beta-N-acetylmuramidase)